MCIVADVEEGTIEACPHHSASPAGNENPLRATGPVTPQSVSSVVGLVSNSGASVGHHQPPYDLRRKSPHHDPAAAAVAPNYPSGCNPAGSNIPSSSNCLAGPSGYAARMLPARKRPRRTCYATCESE